MPVILKLSYQRQADRGYALLRWLFKGVRLVLRSACATRATSGGEKFNSYEKILHIAAAAGTTFQVQRYGEATSQLHSLLRLDGFFFAVFQNRIALIMPRCFACEIGGVCCIESKHVVVMWNH